MMLLEWVKSLLAYFRTARLTTVSVKIRSTFALNHDSIWGLSVIEGSIGIL
jgi:hypothetical protein